jgi:hypothetical protein
LIELKIAKIDGIDKSRNRLLVRVFTKGLFTRSALMASSFPEKYFLTIFKEPSDPPPKPILL